MYPGHSKKPYTYKNKRKRRRSGRTINSSAKRYRASSNAKAFDGAVTYPRRRLGNFGLLTNPTLRIGPQVPPVLMKTYDYHALYSRYISWGDTTYGGQLIWGLNSLYSIDPAVTPPEALPLLIEMNQMYNVCKVMAVKVDVDFYVANAAVNTNELPVNCYVAAVPYYQKAVFPTPSTLSGWQQLESYIRGNPYFASYKTMGVFSCPPTKVSVSKYWRLPELLGSESEYESNTVWDQPIQAGSSTLNANPTQVMTMVIGCNNISSNALPTAGQTVYIDVKYKFYVKYWNPKEQVS